jgi:hypothetical protein
MNLQHQKRDDDRESRITEALETACLGKVTHALFADAVRRLLVR